MNIKSFIKLSCGVFGDDVVSFTGRFGDDFSDVDGMTTPEVGKLLNIACLGLGSTECYVEVGSYRGKSLLLATSGIKNPVYSIENFTSGGEETKIALQNNWLKSLHHGPCKFLFDDFRKLLNRDNIVVPIGVFFYDADHTEEAQYDALNLVIPLLAPEAMIFVDDFREPYARIPTFKWIEENPSSKLIWDLPSPANCSRPWWNGLGVIQWQV